MTDAGILPGPDPVLDAGVCAVPGWVGRRAARAMCWW